MTKEIWINLPVRDINKPKQFYQKLGFSTNPQHPESANMASFLIDEKSGWMYGAGFMDPDGHRWNVLYMDMNKMLQRE